MSTFILKGTHADHYLWFIDLVCKSTSLKKRFPCVEYYLHGSTPDTLTHKHIPNVRILIPL